MTLEELQAWHNSLDGAVSSGRAQSTAPHDVVKVSLRDNATTRNQRNGQHASRYMMDVSNYLGKVRRGRSVRAVDPNQPALSPQSEMIRQTETVNKANRFESGQPTPKPSSAAQLADLYGSYIDQPNDPNAKGSIRDPGFFRKFDAVADPARTGYTSDDIGMLQQNPQYRGIRMVLPQSGGSYGESAMAAGAQQGARILSQGPVGQPDPNDPHNNGIPRYPANAPLDQGGLREEVYGHLITRGYPVYGGTGDFGGEFPPGFNPVGFGQRDQPIGAKALVPRR